MEKYCCSCKRLTPHKEMVQQKKNKYENTICGGIKEFFISRFLLPNMTDYTLKAICDYDRFVICKVCGKKQLENEGKEFE